jgi:hypothetical protein
MGRCDGARRWLRLRALRSGGGLGRRGAGQTLAAGPVGGVFGKTLSEDAWRALRWRFFERHFQYLNAFDNCPTIRRL